MQPDIETYTLVAVPRPTADGWAFLVVKAAWMRRKTAHGFTIKF
jgi:hypothetical protein